MRQDGRRPGRAWRKTRPAEAESRPYVPPKTLKEVLARELARCRWGWEGVWDGPPPPDPKTWPQNLAAVWTALHRLEEAAQIPKWLAHAIRKLLSEGFQSRGALAARWARHWRDVIHTARADHMEWALSHGLTWERAKEYTAEYFSGSDAEGSPETMARSLTLVRGWNRTEPARCFTGRFDAATILELEHVRRARAKLAREGVPEPRLEAACEAARRELWRHRNAVSARFAIDWLPNVVEEHLRENSTRYTAERAVAIERTFFTVNARSYTREEHTEAKAAVRRWLRLHGVRLENAKNRRWLRAQEFDGRRPTETH